MLPVSKSFHILILGDIVGLLQYIEDAFQKLELCKITVSAKTFVMFFLFLSAIGPNFCFNFHVSFLLS